MLHAALLLSAVVSAALRRALDALRDWIWWMEGRVCYGGWHNRRQRFARSLRVLEASERRVGGGTLSRRTRAHPVCVQLTPPSRRGALRRGVRGGNGGGNARVGAIRGDAARRGIAHR